MTSNRTLARLPGNIELLKGAVAGLEQVVRAAEVSDNVRVQGALPFLSLLWLYAVAMRDLLSTTAPDGRMLWNSPALAALCRPLQEAFVSFFYFAIEAPNEQETEFRQLLLAQHKAFKRLDLLRRITPRTSEIEREIPAATDRYEELRDRVLNHPRFSSLPKGIANDFRRAGDRYIAEPLNEIWIRAGLPAELYEATFRYLSQFAHATPFAIEQLAHHQADQEDGAVNMNIPISLALTCTCVALNHMASLDRHISRLLPNAFFKFMGDSRANEGRR